MLYNGIETWGPALATIGAFLRTLMWPFIAIAAATILGMAVNLAPGSSLTGGDGYDLNVFWSLFTVLLVGLVCLACIEVPRRREDERFVSNEPGVVIWPGHAGVECDVRDISLGGARLTRPYGARAWDTTFASGALTLDGGDLHVPFQLLRRHGSDLVVRFDSSLAVRRALIGRLFGGAYAPELERVAIHRVLGMLINRLLN